MLYRCLFIPFPLAIKAATPSAHSFQHPVWTLKLMFHINAYIMKTSSQTDFYQIITDLTIEKLEQGNIPWQKPWNDYVSAVN